MKPHEIWLAKARNDLDSAKILASGERPIVDTAIYHTQQCAEKALKGFLALHEKQAPRTHDLRTLIEYAIEIDNDFNDISDYALSLNPYSTMFRYPDLVFEPKLDDVLDAIETAQLIFDFINNKISK